jgi:hypothetical protein
MERAHTEGMMRALRRVIAEREQAAKEEQDKKPK